MPRIVVFDEFGGPEVLHAVDEPLRDPGPGEARVRIEAFAVNRLDAMMRSGVSPAPVPLPGARLGIEASGVVDALGPGAPGVRVGEPVIITAVPDPAVRGTYAEYTTVPSDALFTRPAGLGSVDAAAVWVGFSTAYGALVEAAHMQPGDRVLVSAASSGVGRAAIQVAARIGAVPIAVVRTAALAEELRAAGAAFVVDDGDGLVDAVRRLTRGAGADIALDLVRGPGQRALLAATRAGGTLVAAGFLDSRPTSQPRGVPVTIVGYRGFDYLSTPDVLARMISFLDDGVRRGALLPAVGEPLDLEHVVDAHRRLEAGLNHGRKIVVTV